MLERNLQYRESFITGIMNSGAKIIESTDDYIVYYYPSSEHVFTKEFDTFVKFPY